MKHLAPHSTCIDLPLFGDEARDPARLTSLPRIVQCRARKPGGNAQ